MAKHSIGQTIATLRKKKRWTQVELAEKLQVSDKAVSKWEKDVSYPSIEFLPKLASLFEVTIDYIVTGKPIGPETIVMSQLEYCAKTDNPELARRFDLSVTDELGNTLIDYMIKYKSVNVFAELFDREDSYFNTEKYSITELYKLAIIANKTNILDRYKFKKHNHVNDYGVLSHYVWFYITDDLLDVIALDNRVNDDTFSYLFSKNYYKSEFTYITLWRLIPHLLHRCYLHQKNDFVELILTESEKNNSYAYVNMPLGYTTNPYSLMPRPISSKHEDKYPNYTVCQCGVKMRDGSNEHYFIRVLRKTINLAKSRGDSYFLGRFNKINNDIEKYSKKVYSTIIDMEEKYEKAAKDRSD